MKYTIEGFSQERLIELGLDVVDAHLLRWFIDFRDSDKMKTVISEEQLWYWVNYAGIIKDLPILKIDKRAIQRRFKKLVEAGILIHFTYRIGGSFSCYNIKQEGNYFSLFNKPDRENIKPKEINSSMGFESTEELGFESTDRKDNKVLSKDSSTIKLSTILNKINNDIVPKARNNSSFPVYSFLGIFHEEYKRKEGKEHPPIKNEQAAKALSIIEESGVLLYGEVGANAIIKDYMENVTCDHNINHFTSGNIIRLRLSEFSSFLPNLEREVFDLKQCNNLRKIFGISSQFVDFLRVFALAFEKHKGYKHPPVKFENLRRYQESLQEVLDLVLDNVESQMKHLKDFFSHSKFSNHQLGYFASDGVVTILSYN